MAPFIALFILMAFALLFVLGHNIGPDRMWRRGASEVQPDSQTKK